MTRLSPVAIKRLLHDRKAPSLLNLLNLWAIEDGALIGTDLQFTALYSLVLPDLTYRTDAELEAFYQSVKNLLHSLPENTTLQFIIRCRQGDGGLVEDYARTVQQADPTADFINRGRVAHLKALETSWSRYYLAITTYTPDTDLRKMRAKAFQANAPAFAHVTREMHEARLASLATVDRAVITQLEPIGIKAARLNDAQMTELLYEYLNPSRASYSEPRPLCSDLTLRSQVALSACEAHFDHVRIDGTYHRAVNLHLRPESLRFSMLDDLREVLTADYDLVVTLHAPNQSQAQSELLTTGTIAKAIAAASKFRAYHEADHQAEQADDLVELVNVSGQKLYGCSFSVILHDKSAGRLNERVADAVQGFRKLGEAEGVIDDMNHLPLFLSALPNHSHLNSRRFLMQTEAAAQLLPLSAPWRGTRRPAIVFPASDQQLVSLDLFDPGLPAKHGLVIGSTGSGKSFTTNMLLSSFYIESERNHIVIIDVGGSYRKFAAITGGSYLEIELSDKYAFNPFPDPTFAVTAKAGGGIEVNGDTLGFLTNLIQKMLNRPDLPGREQIIIEKAIIDAYRRARPDTPVLSHFQEALRDLEGDNEDRETARGFAKDMEIWTTGRYGRMLNRPTTVKSDARLIVFDLQKLGEDPRLQSIVFFLIQNVIQAKLANKSLQKIIAIDEGWRFFNDAVGVKLIMDLYKTARKFNGAVLSISQSPQDFLATPAAAAIIENSYTKYVLRLGGGFDRLPEFRLTAADIARVRGLKMRKGVYSQVFVQFGDNRRVVQITPSPVDYWVCTTDPDDEAKEKQMRRTNPAASEMEILELLAASKNGKGEHR